MSGATLEAIGLEALKKLAQTATDERVRMEAARELLAEHRRSQRKSENGAEAEGWPS